MNEGDSEDERTADELAEASLLRGGERISKGRRRADRDDV